jgi:large subunit ribosomal protein L17
MRHGVKLNRLGRKTPHRKALMANLAIALIEHKRIITTLAKAKALRVYVEPILTKSKTDSTHNRRLVFSDLQNKESIKELFGTVSTAIANRPGGYTRIIKMAPRLGDAAEMALIELVDFNTIYTGNGEVADDKKKTRRSRGKKSDAGSTTTTAPKAKASKNDAEAVAEVEIEEVVVPVVEEAAPAVEEAAPAVEESAPAVEESAPAVEEAAPVVEEAVPAVEEAAPVVEEAVPAVEEAAPAVEESVSGDDLKIVEGIGPKIAELFNAKGITTFAQLAATSTEEMAAILEEGGPAFMGKDPGTWAQQAQMAAEGKWDELKAWQDELNGGK